MIEKLQRSESELELLKLAAAKRTANEAQSLALLAQSPQSPPPPPPPSAITVTTAANNRSTYNQNEEEKRQSHESLQLKVNYKKIIE